MHSSPNRFSQNKSKKQKLSKNAHTFAQHESASASSLSHYHHLKKSGRWTPILQRFPYETLCHITSYLDPASLTSLSGVSIFFKEYLADDVVWKLALFANVLDIRPEHEKDSPRAFLLRRVQSTWKAEYIERFKVLTGWSQSRTTYTAHQPLMVPAPNLHLLSDGESLLAAPGHFSWVVRTVPSTGKIYKGHFQPTLPSQAHPLNDWSPPTAGAIASEGNTTRIVWGSQVGDVMVKTAQLLADSKPIRRAPAVASSIDDRHAGVINSISWATASPKHPKINAHATSTAWFLTAAEDGHVKLWNAECNLAWTSPRSPDDAPFVRAEFDLTSNTAVALSESGTVMVWVYLPIPNIDGNIPAEEMITLVGRIPQESPPRRVYTATSKLLFDYAAPVPSVIVHVQDDLHAYRFQLNVTHGEVVCSRVAGPLGTITAVALVPTRGAAGSEGSILLVGDSLSLLSIYDLGGRAVWQDGVLPPRPDDSNGTSSTNASSNVNADISKMQTPNLALTTHDYGAITAIATNGFVLASGNELGMITIWDAVTLASVRSIDASNLVKADVGVITLLCQREQIIASVGNTVVHWRTGNIVSRMKKQSKGVGGKMVSAKGKYHLDEYKRAIRDSQAELEITSKRVPPVVFSEQEQRLALQALGLDESGAVELALMLSHDEATQQGLVDPDLVDFGDSLSTLSAPQSPTETVASISTDFTSSTTPSGTTSGTPSATAQDASRDFIPSSPWKSTSMSRLSPPNPNALGKVQVSPQYHPEAMSVGPKRPSTNSTSSGSDKGSSMEETFPCISPSPPSTNKGSGATTPLVSGVSTPAVSSRVSVSPKEGITKTPGAAGMGKPPMKWSTIVKSSTPSPSISGTASPSGRAGGRGSNSARPRGAAGGSRAASGGKGRGAQEEDAQLQFALELSLAEAVSRQG